MTELTEARWAGRAQGAIAIVGLVVVAQFWPGWQLDSAANKEIAIAYNEGYTLAQGDKKAFYRFHGWFQQKRNRW